MMKKLKKMMLAAGAAAVWCSATLSTRTYAAVSTSILPPDTDIENLLKMAAKILIYGLGAAGVLGVVICGILYLTARDNEAQATTAKKRLFEVVIGLVAWALLYSVLNWLVPGGVSDDIFN